MSAAEDDFLTGLLLAEVSLTGMSVVKLCCALSLDVLGVVLIAAAAMFPEELLLGKRILLAGCVMLSVRGYISVYVCVDTWLNTA